MRQGYNIRIEPSYEGRVEWKRFLSSAPDGSGM